MPGNSDRGSSNEGDHYLIDETVELEDFDGNMGYVWEIEEDMDPESEYTIRAIARSRGNIEVHILPVEEAEAFESGENFWPEWSTPSQTEIQADAAIDTDDEDPYFHSGDLRLAVERTGGTPEKVTMKFRERD